MSSFGSVFRISTFGESHCKGVGVIVDGCPPGLPLIEDDIQKQLNRRRPGQSNLTTPRDEKDKVTIMSGTELGYTLGTPIALTVPNLDQRPHDYSETDFYPRPSHADYTYLKKYNIKASSGGGRSSARETIGRVAAGAIAEKYLKLAYNIDIVAFVSSVGEITMDPQSSPVNNDSESLLSSWKQWWETLNSVTREMVDVNEVRCPNEQKASEMRQRIIRARDNQDSIGGTVICVIRNVPAGLGEPCFDKIEAKLAHAMLSIPATKGFEIGSGFQGTKIPGHLHNDPFHRKEDGSLGTLTNFSAGIQGGITNGENIYFKVAFKPPATIGIAQKTSTYDGNDGVLAAKGRHDPCVVPRAVAIVESMAALVVMDMLMMQLSRNRAAELIHSKDIPSILRPKTDPLSQ